MSTLVEKILLKGAIIILVMSLMSASREFHSERVRANKITPNDLNSPYVIGGFDFSRGGDGGSLQYGAYYSEARSSIVANLPNPTFISFSTLTPDSVKGINVILLSSTYNNLSAISPLTANEQTVLLNYVKSGGCAIILTDNFDFGGVPTSSDANQSLIKPFNITTDGFLIGTITATVLNPSNSLITNGPYGIISSFYQYYPGYFTSDGIYATRLANNPSGGALDVINADAIQSGSGPVIMFSDANAFFDDRSNGFFLENENMFLNIVHFCYIRSSTQLYTINGLVKDSKGNGIPNVVVSVLNSGRATTDGQGSYTISALPAGSYTVEPYSQNYAFTPASQMVSLPPDVHQLDFLGSIVFKNALPLVSISY